MSRPRTDDRMRCAICGANTSEDWSWPITEDHLFELGMARVTQPPLRIDETCARLFRISQPPKEATMNIKDMTPEDGRQVHFQEFEEVPASDESHFEDFDLRELYDTKYRERFESLLRDMDADNIPVHMVACLAQADEGDRSFIHQLYAGRYKRVPLTMIVARKIYEDDCFRELVMGVIHMAMSFDGWIMAEKLGDVIEEALEHERPGSDEDAGQGPAGDNKPTGESS